MRRVPVGTRMARLSWFIVWYGTILCSTTQGWARAIGIAFWVIGASTQLALGILWLFNKLSDTETPAPATQRAHSTAQLAISLLRRTESISRSRHASGAAQHWPLFETLQFSADAYTAAFTHELPRYDLRRQVPGLDMPTLLIVGSDDPYCAHMEWLAEHIPSATLCALPGVGHFPFVEAAEQFTQRVAAFINDHRH